MLPWVCSVIDHRRRQNVVKTAVTHLPAARLPLLCFLSDFDVICDLLLNITDARQHEIYLLNRKIYLEQMINK